MRNLFSQLWNDDNGVVGLEYLVLATIIGLGLIVGAMAVASALDAEFTELANAITTLNQSFSVDSISGCNSAAGGSSYVDLPDSQTLTFPPPAAAQTNSDGVAICP